LWKEEGMATLKQRRKTSVLGYTSGLSGTGKKGKKHRKVCEIIRQQVEKEFCKAEKQNAGTG
jgi:hypothetical protein